MKKNILIKITIFILFSSIVTSCDNRSGAEALHDYLKDELLPKNLEGFVKKTELWKGCYYDIDLKTKTGKIEKIRISNDCDILFQIKKGDYINKIINSNKCSITRNDSIIYIDCFDLKRQTDKDKSLLTDLKIEQWDRAIINKWTLKKN